MAHHANRLALAALISCAAAVPAWADPASSASSASSTASQSVGSISGSIQRSSNSSTGNNVAEGDYRIIEVRSFDRFGGPDFEPNVRNFLHMGILGDDGKDAVTDLRAFIGKKKPAKRATTSPRCSKPALA